MSYVPNVIMVIAPDKFRDEELFETKRVLEEKGIAVTVASITKEEVTGSKGGKIIPDELINDIKVEEMDVLIFIGGAGAVTYFKNEGIHYLIKTAYNKGVIIGAICIAPTILALAGILKGKKATAFPSEKTFLESMGVKYVDQNVVKDGHIVTANGASAAVEFGKTIIKALIEKYPGCCQG
ncbi:MAG TPA: DJ-1/PfpI family protein [Candidatus Nanoarchaeia archaeon]|nr:DJ-1/PfpI family protein [Candidatus Nanoarchaeia archaeon]